MSQVLPQGQNLLLSLRQLFLCIKPFLTALTVQKVSFSLNNGKAFSIRLTSALGLFKLLAQMGYLCM